MGVNMGPGFLPPPNSSASESLPNSGNGMDQRVAKSEKLIAVAGDNIAKAEVDLINQKRSAELASTDALSSDRPNPARPQDFAATLAALTAVGGEKSTSATGNPYFAPNAIAILSAQIHAFYAISRQIQLGMAHVENEGMKLVAEQAKANAEAQIEAGKKEAMSHYGSMVMGAAQIVAGMAQMGGSLYATMKVQQTAVKAAEEAAKEAADKVADTSEKFALAQSKHAKEVLELQNLQKAKSASTSVPDPSEAVKVEMNIINQQKQVDKAAKQMDEAADIMNADKKVYAAKAELVSVAQKEVQQTQANLTALTSGISSMVTGMSQVGGHYIIATAAQQKAIEEAKLTIGQSLVQLLQRGLIEATHQAADSNAQTMSGILQALDKSVDAHAQANNMV